MEKRSFGNTGMQVSVLGFGGSEIGYEGASQKDVDQLLGNALDAGLNVIDTAACYRNSEELIGKAVAHRRSEYYLFSKCGHASGLPHDDWSRELIAASLERSLRLLRTEYLDLLQLHSCSEEILRRGEVIEELQKAKQAGKVRFIGYSGDRDAGLYAVRSGVFDAYQTSVNIADQEAISLTIPEALKRNMGVIAKRPVANAAWRYDGKPSDGYHVPYWERFGQLRYDFLQGDLSAAVNTALRFTLAIPGVHTAIVGMANPQRYRQNAQLLAAQGAMTAEQFAAIRADWQERAKSDWRGMN